jgi:Arc/MetJ-type ribon-helix-helix transcriptional regulator
MAPTTQITVRLSTDLVEWVDQYLGEEYPSRAALIEQALQQVRRRKQADDDLRRFLAIEEVESTDPDRDEWMRTREYPEMGEPAKVLHPERYPELAQDA